MPHRRLRFEEQLDMRDLSIRLDDCVCVVPGPVDADIVNALDENRFDQAAVFDRETRRLWGLVATKHLRALLDGQVELAADDPKIMREEIEFRVGCFVSIYELIERITQHRAVIVIGESDATEYGHAEFLHGLFTISDLNRHAVRGILYVLLSQIEAGLAVLVERVLPEPWSWLSFLNEEAQVRALGYWELSKRRGVDVGPIAATSLAQLLTVAARSDRVRNALGYSSGNSFSRDTGRIPEFRNRVMHPVRPLVLGLEDVQDIHRTLTVLEQLRDRVEAFLGSSSDSFRRRAAPTGEVEA